MLVARQQPLAHYCDFRGWLWLPLTPQHLESPISTPISATISQDFFVSFFLFELS